MKRLRSCRLRLRPHHFISPRARSGRADVHLHGPVEGPGVPTQSLTEPPVRSIVPVLNNGRVVIQLPKALKICFQPLWISLALLKLLQLSLRQCYLPPKLLYGITD